MVVMGVSRILGVIICVLKVAEGRGGTDCNDGRYYIREDPTSCTHFYKCDNGNPVLFPCPGTLYYNPSTHNCDWSYNVKCDVNKGQQSGDGGSGQSFNNNGGQYNNNNGYPNNNGGQYNSNNGYPNNYGGQYDSNNGYPNNNGGQYNNNNEQYNGNQYQPGNYQNQNQFDDSDFYYPVQPVDAQDPEIGPSIVEPDGIFDENRPRPTIDQLYSSNNHPYQDYLYPNIDVRK